MTPILIYFICSKLTKVINAFHHGIIIIIMIMTLNGMFASCKGNSKCGQQKENKLVENQADLIKENTNYINQSHLFLSNFYMIILCSTSYFLAPPIFPHVSISWRVSNIALHSSIPSSRHSVEMQPPPEL